MADARHGTVTPTTPLRLARMSAVASGVRVMAVSTPAQSRVGLTAGHRECPPDALLFILALHLFTGLSLLRLRWLDGMQNERQRLGLLALGSCKLSL